MLHGVRLANVCGYTQTRSIFVGDSGAQDNNGQEWVVAKSGGLFTDTPVKGGENWKIILERIFRKPRLAERAHLKALSPDSVEQTTNVVMMTMCTVIIGDRRTLGK